MTFNDEINEWLDSYICGEDDEKWESFLDLFDLEDSDLIILADRCREIVHSQIQAALLNEQRASLVESLLQDVTDLRNENRVLKEQIIQLNKFITARRKSR